MFDAVVFFKMSSTKCRATLESQFPFWDERVKKMLRFFLCMFVFVNVRSHVYQTEFLIWGHRCS